MKAHAFHYTTLQLAHVIIGTGVILPATIDVRPPELPVVWLSEHPKWEPTANKYVVDFTSGRSHRMSFGEMVDGPGIARFQVPTFRLIPWNRIQDASQMQPTMWAALRRVGLDQGANPKQWWASTRPIPVSEVVAIEVYIQGRWTRFAQDNLPAT